MWRNYEPDRQPDLPQGLLLFLELALDVAPGGVSLCHRMFSAGGSGAFSAAVLCICTSTLFVHGTTWGSPLGKSGGGRSAEIGKGSAEMIRPFLG